MGEYGVATEAEQEHRLSEDELFELLSNQRRRHVLHALLREGEPIDVWSLAHEIAAWEDGVPAEEITTSDRKRVYTALLQSHLPKLERRGVVEFDREQGTVASLPPIERVEVYVDVVRRRELPWSDYYLGLTALSGLLLVGVAASIYPFSVAPPQGAVGAIVAAFGASALAHWYYARQNRLGGSEQPPTADRDRRRRE